MDQKESDMHEANFGPSGLSSRWSNGACFPPWGRWLSALSALPASFHSVLSLPFHCEHRCCAVQCHLDGVSSSFLHPDADPIGLVWGSRSFLSSRFRSDAKKRWDQMVDEDICYKVWTFGLCHGLGDGFLVFKYK